MKRILVCYIPVLHSGYLRFLQRHRNVDQTYILGEDFISQNRSLKKDIRRLEVSTTVRILSLLGFQRIDILSESSIDFLSKEKNLQIILPDDYLHRSLSTRFASHVVKFDNTFLQRDPQNAFEKKDVVSSTQISQGQFEIDVMCLASKEARYSSDWWRHVGATLVRDGVAVVSTHNIHVPTEYEPYLSGDVRSWFSRGINVDVSTAFHAEAVLVSLCAREGIATKDADIFVTTFPCVSCAKLIAHTGVRRLYFRDGYSVLDGQELISSRGIEIIRVQ